MDVAHRLRLAEIEQIVVAAHLAVPGIEARAAIAGLVQLVVLDHRAHRAVEHEDALGRGSRAGSCSTLITRPPSSRGPQAQQMADRVDEIGAVHGVEMEIADAAIDQIEHLFGGDRGGDQLARRRIVIEPVEARREPVRHRGAGALGETLRLLEVLHRQDARRDRHVDAARAHAVEIAEIEIVLEEELRDRARRAGIDLRRQHVDVGIDRGAVRMLLRIGRHRTSASAMRLMPATRSAPFSYPPGCGA